MRFGICTAPENAQTLARLGFDYVECAITTLAAMEDGAFDEVRRAVEASPLMCESGNLFLPGTCRITGEAANFDAALAHLRVAVPRFAALGGQIAVFGSGGARAVPEGWPKDKAMEQLARFCRLAGGICAEHGVRIAIEPLNTGECNIINSVSEGVDLAEMAAHPNVGVLADWYHVAVENEGVDGILRAGSRLWHCHIARPQGRAYPSPGDPEDAGYDAFFGALRAIGYEGRVSIEGRGDPAQDGGAALTALRAARG